jgi:hypothetical protein
LPSNGTQLVVSTPSKGTAAMRKASAECGLPRTEVVNAAHDTVHEQYHTNATGQDQRCMEHMVYRSVAQVVMVGSESGAFNTAHLHLTATIACISQHLKSPSHVGELFDGSDAALRHDLISSQRMHTVNCIVSKGSENQRTRTMQAVLKAVPTSVQA